MKKYSSPSFNAFKTLHPKPRLTIIGLVDAPTSCDQPYLQPLKGQGRKLLFELKFKNIAKPGSYCHQTVTPATLKAYSGSIKGDETEVLIKMPRQAKLIVVPINLVP